MTRAKAGARLGMEVLMKKHQFLKTRLITRRRLAAVTGPRSVFTLHEERGETCFQFSGDLLERHHLPRTRGTFNFKSVAVVLMVSSQRLYENKINREPDRTSPVAVTTEHTRPGHARFVRYGMALAIEFENIRRFLVYF